MQSNEINEITRILQTAISPVVLISGIGLLVLSLTNRFARTTDRARALSNELKLSNIVNRENLALQIHVLYRRSKILMYSISFALASIFFVALLVIALFSEYSLHLIFTYAITLLFSFSLISLIISLILFIKDMSLSLKALRLEIKDDLGEEEKRRIIG